MLSPEEPTDPAGLPLDPVPGVTASPAHAVSEVTVPSVQPNRRLRLWLAMGAGILALLCLGGVGLVVSLYDGATEIKRSSPDAVVDNFLGAYLVDRNDQQAALYTCESRPDLTSISNLRNELVQRETTYHVTVSVTWEAFTISGTDTKRSVSTFLTIAGSANGITQSRRTEQWTFSMVEQDGWRVCGAYKVV